MTYFITAYLVSIFLVILNAKHDPSEEAATAVAVSFLPGLGILFGFICLIDIVRRHVKTKGTCTLGHSYREESNTHAMKIQMGLPITGQYGGSRYKCVKCKGQILVRWSAY